MVGCWTLFVRRTAEAALSWLVRPWRGRDSSRRPEPKCWGDRQPGRRCKSTPAMKKLLVVPVPGRGSRVMDQLALPGYSLDDWRDSHQSPPALLRSGQQAQGPGFGDCLPPAVHAKLAVDVAGMDLYRLSRDKNLLSNFTIG